MSSDAIAGLLDGKSVMIVEDEAFIAMELEYILGDAGASIVGPVASLETAMKTAETAEFDVAVLDIMLGREEVFPLADMLRERGIGFVFHSAHAEPQRLEKRYPGVALISKPSSAEQIAQSLAALG